MTHQIRLLDDWTNPETGEQHHRGDLLRLPDRYFRLEGMFGLQGKYTTDLMITAPPLEEVQKAPKSATKKPAPPAYEDTDTLNDSTTDTKE